MSDCSYHERPWDLIIGPLAGGIGGYEDPLISHVLIPLEHGLPTGLIIAIERVFRYPSFGEILLLCTILSVHCLLLLTGNVDSFKMNYFCMVPGINLIKLHPDVVNKCRKTDLTSPCLGDFIANSFSVAYVSFKSL